MPATYITNVALTGIDGLISYLDSVFLAAGWSSVAVLNTATGNPSVNALGQERVYQINGTTLAPARSYVGMARYNGPNTGVLFYGGSAAKGPVGIASANYAGAGANFQFTTTGPHPFVNGDLVLVNGVSNAGFNRGSYGTSPTAAAQTVTNVSTNYFEIPSLGPSGTFSGTGGHALGLYNLYGNRDSASPVAVWQGNDAAMQLYGAIDEFRCAFVIQQGGQTLYVEVGQAGRRHIPAAFSDTAFTTNAVTGPGPVTIMLDRPSPNLCAAQFAWLVSSNSALFERFSVTSVVGTTVTGTLSGTGTYPAGSLFGDDPCPVGVVAQPYSSTAIDLGSYTGLYSFFTNGTRTDVNSLGQNQTYRPLLDSDLRSSTSANDSSGYQQGRPIVLVRTSSPVGVRANIAGTSVDLVAGWGLSSQTDGDLEQTACASSSSYKVFTSQEILGALGGDIWLVGFGPGAS